MKIELKKLELTNYRNIAHAEYEFNGNSKIVGDNRIGKTNTLEAINYLLTGVLLNGSNDVQAIKPLADTKAVVDVKGTFDVDGKTITIEKKYGEDWVKQRNTSELVLKGHFNEIYYNDVKQNTVKEFNALFYKDFGIKTNDAVKISFVQLLTNPFYIGDLCDTDDWKEVRKLIIDLVGDVSDDDVFEAEPETAILSEELELANGRIDQVRKKVDGEIKSLKELLLTDGAKIEMLEKVEKPSDDDLKFAKEKLEDINQEIASLRSQKSSNEIEIDLRNKIASKQMELAKAKTPKADEEYTKALDKQKELYAQRDVLVNNVNQLNQKIGINDFKLQKAKEEKTQLIEKYKRIKNESANIMVECPTCHKPLSAEEIAEHTRKADEEHQARLDENIKLGKAKASEIQSYESIINDCKTELSSYEPQLDSIMNELKALADKIASHEPIYNNELINQLTNEINELNYKLAQVREDESKARAETSQRIYELEEIKAPYQKVVDDVAYAERQANTKEQVKVEKENHSQTLIKKEQLKDMINKFTFTKLQLLDKAVSNVFGNIKFQLIKENINGGFDTVCKPYIYDPVKNESTNVLWKSGSKSERVATGIAIAEKIKAKMYLSDLPYLFDEGGEISTETINNRLKTNAQIICVKVEDNVNSPIVVNL